MARCISPAVRPTAGTHLRRNRHAQRSRAATTRRFTRASTISAIDPRAGMDRIRSRARTIAADAATDQGEVQVKPLGPLQRRLLAALIRHGRDASLQSLAELAAGLIPTLD